MHPVQYKERPVRQSIHFHNHHPIRERKSRRKDDFVPTVQWGPIIFFAVVMGTVFLAILFGLLHKLNQPKPEKDSVPVGKVIFVEREREKEENPILPTKHEEEKPIPPVKEEKPVVVQQNTTIIHNNTTVIQQTTVIQGNPSQSPSKPPVKQQVVVKKPQNDRCKEMKQQHEDTVAAWQSTYFSK